MQKNKKNKKKEREKRGNKRFTKHRTWIPLQCKREYTNYNH